MKKIIHHRPIRSYVLRQGRLTPSQRRAIEECWSFYGLEVTETPYDFAELFGSSAPVTLEVGFGNGESLLTQAQQSPEKNFIGIEVHTPGVGHLIAEANRLDVKNLRVFQHDAVEVFNKCVANSSLDTVQVFFPDPWPKKRHHKRRLIQPAFVELIATKLKSRGRLHCATDWENYAEHMMDVLSASDDFENEMGEGLYSFEPRLLRPLTKFEQRGLRLKHEIRDLLFIKKSECT